MSSKRFLVLFLAVGAVLARPQPQDSGGASERDGLNDDEEEEKICISVKGSSIAEMSQVNGELPPMLILKLSGNSKPKLVHYKLVTVAGSSEDFFPEVKLVTHAPTNNSAQGRASEQVNGTVLSKEAFKELPYRENPLNGDTERNVFPKAAENNTAGSVDKNRTEGTFEADSQHSGGLIVLTRTPDVSTVTEAVTASVSNVTDIGPVTTRFTTSRLLSGIGDDESQKSGGETSEFQAVTSKSNSFAGTELPDSIDHSGDGGNVTVYRNLTVGDFKSLNSSILNKTQDERRVNETVTANKDLERNHTTDDTDTTTKAWTNLHGLDQKENSTDAVLIIPGTNSFSEPDVNSFSKPVAIDSSFATNETEVMSGGNETNSTVTTGITPIDDKVPSTVIEEGVEGETMNEVSKYEQHQRHQNGTGNSTLTESTAVQQDADETTIIYRGSSESTKATTITHITQRAVDGGSSSGHSLDQSAEQVDTSTTTESLNLATDNRQILSTDPFNENQATTILNIDSTTANIREGFRDLPIGDGDEASPTPTPPPEVVTDKTGAVGDLSSESLNDSNTTSSTTLPSGANESFINEDKGVGENAFAISITPTKQPSEIVTSASGEVLEVLSVEDSTKPSEIVTSASGEVLEVLSIEESTKQPSEIVTSASGEVLEVLSIEKSTKQPSEIVTSASGEVLEVLSVEDENHSTAGSTESFDENDNKITDGAHDSPTDDNDVTPIEVTTTSEPWLVTGGNVLHHRILSSDQQAETTQRVLSSTLAHISSTEVVGSELGGTSSTHHEPTKIKLLSESPSSSIVTPTIPAGDFRGLPVTEYEYKISSVSEATGVMKPESEEVEIVTSHTPVKAIPIYSYHSTSSPSEESSPPGTPSRQLEDWEKFNNFTIIIPIRPSYYRVEHPPPIPNYYFQPGSHYRLYRPGGRIQFVQLPIARQI